uniref:FBA_2 domain-containing protein n=1 Tax=Steinernema glaseri TaxID=37863 RepID=A0A1I7YFI9_9BILA
MRRVQPVRLSGRRSLFIIMLALADIVLDKMENLLLEKEDRPFNVVTPNPWKKHHVNLFCEASLFSEDADEEDCLTKPAVNFFEEQKVPDWLSEKEECPPKVPVIKVRKEQKPSTPQLKASEEELPNIICHRSIGTQTEILNKSEPKELTKELDQKPVDVRELRYICSLDGQGKDLVIKSLVQEHDIDEDNAWFAWNKNATNVRLLHLEIEQDKSEPCHSPDNSPMLWSPFEISTMEKRGICIADRRDKAETTLEDVQHELALPIMKYDDDQEDPKKQSTLTLNWIKAHNSDIVEAILDATLFRFRNLNIYNMYDGNWMPTIRRMMERFIASGTLRKVTIENVELDDSFLDLIFYLYMASKGEVFNAELQFCLHYFSAEAIRRFVQKWLDAKQECDMVKRVAFSTTPAAWFEAFEGYRQVPEMTEKAPVRRVTIMHPTTPGITAIITFTHMWDEGYGRPADGILTFNVGRSNKHCKGSHSGRRQRP